MKKKLFASVIITAVVSALLVYCFYFVNSNLSIYNLILWLFIIIALAGFCEAFNFLFRKESGFKEFAANRKNSLYIVTAIVQIATIVTLLTSPFAVRILDYHKLELESKDSIVCYNVIVEDRNDTKYTLPAKILVSSDDEEKTSIDTITGDKKSVNYTRKEFIVTEVLPIREETLLTTYLKEHDKNAYEELKKGQSIFDKGITLKEPVCLSKPGDKTLARDEDGKTWYITLTNDYIEDFEDEQLANLSFVAYLEYGFSLIGSLLMLFCLYAIMYCKK